AASDAVKSFVAGGARGEAPRLAPAHGGRAKVHRFEGGEHMAATDNAVKTMTAAGKTVDPAVAGLLAQKVKLKNGLEVSPGDLTAMMGDFYGAFDKGKDGKEHFNARASFDALTSADPKEMNEILKRIHAERDSVEGRLGDQSKSFEATG